MEYKFTDNKASFKVDNAQKTSYLYFPLTNAEGNFLSSISPNLSGDIKQDNDHFLMQPISIEDTKNNLLCRREFFLKILSEKNKIIRLSYNSPTTVKAGLLYHTIEKDYKNLSIETTNFVPFDKKVEVMKIKIKNKSKKEIKFIPTSFIPLFGRPEHNLRDHRHVSSLLNRIKLKKYGILLKPSMVFEERGHKENSTIYYGLGYNDNKKAPLGQFPTVLSFCGEGQDITNPEAVYGKVKPFTKKIEEFDGKENCASFRFNTKTLKPNQETTYIIMLGISENEKDINSVFSKLNSIEKINNSLEETKKYWQKTASKVEFDFGNNHLNCWTKWVSLQPTLRKLFGCSFLPHFDYGKGGRGWRDLWQDALNLLIVEPETTRKMILSNFKGVRIDGSNATIITNNGNFISDRNSISRVWMDHGVWPYLTLKEYIHRSNDIDILIKETEYFSDHQFMRGKKIDRTKTNSKWQLKTKNNKIYKGTILEHVLIQTLVQFFNVGDHNITKLENADWNDGLDMAANNGESVAFSCMYADNLSDICILLKELKKKVKDVELLKELLLLIDTDKVKTKYTSAKLKQKRLNNFLEKTYPSISGKKVKVPIDKLIKDLERKASWYKKHIRKKEWLNTGFFNGYYDDEKKRVEGKINGTVQMMLTSQVFAIMSGIASDNQIRKILNSAEKYLFDKKLKGYRLNTNRKDNYLKLGRAFGFSFGDKENGAFFNHMIIMFAYALYKRNFIKEADKVLSSIYKMSISSKAKIYPIIPEYFNGQGRGLYLYLTGSASWYIHTLIHQSLGVHYEFGDLVIIPKLSQKNFPKKKVSVKFTLSDKPIKITYTLNKNKLSNTIIKAALNKETIKSAKTKVVIDKKTLNNLSSDKVNQINIVLD